APPHAMTAPPLAIPTSGTASHRGARQSIDLRRLGLIALEAQRRRVDAVALAGRLRPVVEDVTEVAAAGAAEDLRAPHEQAVVGAQLDGRRHRRLNEARPAGPGFELGGGVEERRSAGGATIGAVGLVEHVLPREGRLGGCTSQHLVLLPRHSASVLCTSRCSSMALVRRIKLLSGTILGLRLSLSAPSFVTDRRRRIYARDGPLRRSSSARG